MWRLFLNLNQPLDVNLILPAQFNKGRSALRRSSMALNNPNPLGPWKVSLATFHGWLLNRMILLLFFILHVLPGLMMSMVCVSVHTSVCACGMCILHVCICILSRSQFTTRRTSRGSAWNLPQPARISWSVASTTSAPWRWSVARKSKSSAANRPTWKN